MWRMRRCCVLLLLGACNFRVTVVTEDAAPTIDAPPPVQSWWDAGYRYRRRLVVTTGAVTPDKGYAGYTVRLAPFDPATFTGLGASCDDLRVVTYDGATWTELPRHLLGCGTAAADLRFAAPIDLPSQASWYGAYVYYGNPSAAAPSSNGVYLWWDDAATNRAAMYARGRFDPWLSTGHDNSLQWNAAGYYTYDTGDDSQSSYRRAVEERDVFIEAELFHTGCYTNNMQTSVCVRGVIASGTGASEQADHYYCTTRAQNPSCNDTDQGIYDGDIVKTDNEIIAVQGMADPPPIVPNQWRKQALAAFGATPTQLRFWDADAGWSALAVPPASALQATGSDATDHTQRGFAGVMTAQDIGRLRNVVIRRYVEPEPSLTVEQEEVRLESQ